MGFNKNNVVFTKGDNDLENSENNNNTTAKKLRLHDNNIYKFTECIKGHINIYIVLVWFFKFNAISQESSSNIFGL